MNANELIEFQEDKASEARANGFSDVWFMQTATMLRILDGQLAFRIDAVTKYQARVQEQQAEIEALKDALQAVITISDRKHDAWDKAKELLK